jgi:hypothetical protein
MAAPQPWLALPPRPPLLHAGGGGGGDCGDDDPDLHAYKYIHDSKPHTHNDVRGSIFNTAGNLLNDFALKYAINVSSAKGRNFSFFLLCKTKFHLQLVSITYFNLQF